jgi:hypothetical protein
MSALVLLLLLCVVTTALNLPKYKVHRSSHLFLKENDQPENDFLRSTFRRLAELSLQDWQLRSDAFKSSEAERMVEESLARMRGQEANYVRPMDAQNKGPIGRWEASTVLWFKQVFQEEALRAKRIINSDGEIVRPIQAAELGPLGYLEKTVVDFLQSILQSETARARTKTLRPKDLDESLRGPLGRLEQDAVRMLEDIRESENLRSQLQLQSRSQGDKIVRPIDVPGPLGEFELKVSELFYAEQKRTAEKQKREGKVVRPMDAQWRGPLGEAELNVYETIKELHAEEMERLRNIQRVLQEQRPMEAQSDSMLGILESILVGLLRGPQLLVSVVERVRELMDSELLPDRDRQVLDVGPEAKEDGKKN